MDLGVDVFGCVDEMTLLCDATCLTGGVHADRMTLISTSIKRVVLGHSILLVT